jgi:hypothetical protein
MINLKPTLLQILCILLISTCLNAQEELILGGGFQTNANLFLRDSQIGAFDIPQYDNQLFGSESWLDLSASYQGFTGGIRFDAFNNSNLLNPRGSYTAYGIGKWYIQKETDKFEVQAGYIYDQIGSGIIYRAYEERAQLIDNALIGVAGKVFLSDNWSIRGFVGKQKNLFESYNSIIKGFAINGFIKPFDSSSLSLAPGFGFVNRTLGDETIYDISSIVGFYQAEDKFIPYYNSNEFTFFNNLNYKYWSWYLETAFKPKDIFEDPTAVQRFANGDTVLGKFVSKSGSVLYTSLGFAKDQLGITAELKRTENFAFRSDPLLTDNNGFINFIPPMARNNTYRLTTLYYPATQFLNEMAYQIDLKYGINHWNFTINHSQIRDKKFDKRYYTEWYLETVYKFENKWQLLLGIQKQNYNQELYLGHIDKKEVEAITPFAEFLYKFTRTNSIRIEAQYMSNDEDRGSWIFGLVELGFAPHWLIEFSDMYNTKPPEDKIALHYPTLGAVYTYHANRFSIRYAKQIEGIICSGGICRLEPAFSGIRASITTTF